MQLTAIYPGTFDPITYGHLDIIQRASGIFPKLIIAVAENKAKKPWFDLSQRIAFIKTNTQHLSNIEVKGFDSLLVDFAQEEKAKIIIRSIRGISDFDFESQLAKTNRKLSPNLETFFLLPSDELQFISSSLIKEIASSKKDISLFVPANILEAINNYITQQNT